jgi:penicillin amidase
MQKLRQLSYAAGLLARAVRLGPPQPVSTAERLAMIPLRGLALRAAVDIRWDSHQVPSIEASCEEDLAAGLGVVHAHLRLAQMEAMRHIATGRVAEVIGPAGIEIDRALRLMDFGRAVPAMITALPDRTRRWAEGFLAGVNHVIAHAPALPYELRLFDVAPQPWTLADLLSVTRLASADVSWLVFGRLLRAQAQMPAPMWNALFPQMQAGDTLPWPERPDEAAVALFRGSNSAVVPAGRSATGSGLIASDPHLGIALPPLWLVAALHAPGLDAVGLMIPGLPVIGLGRNHHIAWGGTSLHAASSELVDVSSEPMTVREETIAVRGRAPVRLRLRETRFGPVVSDGMLMRSKHPVALRWVGHRASDELTCLLDVMRARDCAGFRAALRPFAVPGQTMLVVEARPEGRASRVIAAHLPRRPNGPMATLVCPPGEAWPLDDLVYAADTDLAEDGALVSANDQPAPLPVPAGFFFSLPERARRMRELLSAPSVTAANMRDLQLDLLQPRSLALRDVLLARLPAPPAQCQAAWDALAAWDGRYGCDSAGALVFEVTVAAIARRTIPRKTLKLLGVIWSGRAIVADRVQHATAPVVAAGLRKAAWSLRRFGDWGAVHRLALRHPLAALPGVGHWFSEPTIALPGSNDTLNKSGHGMVSGRHRVTFGACARHRSDLSDPDANGFVLLGGQDGWLGSANAADQVPLWRAGETISVPLRPEPARAWPHRTLLMPA